VTRDKGKVFDLNHAGLCLGQNLFAAIGRLRGLVDELYFSMLADAFHAGLPVFGQRAARANARRVTRGGV